MLFICVIGEISGDSNLFPVLMTNFSQLDFFINDGDFVQMLQCHSVTVRAEHCQQREGFRWTLIIRDLEPS